MDRRTGIGQTIMDNVALNRALLARQLLLGRAELPVLTAVERLAGLQAQAPNPPYTGLWARLAGFHQSDLSTLVESKEIVRLTLMRGTIHLVSAADALAWRPLIQPVLDRAFRSTYGKFLEGIDWDDIAAAARELVEEQPRTIAELGPLLGRRWPDRDHRALASAARERLALVQVPPRGLWGVSGQAAFTTIESWLGKAPEAGSLDDMVLRYLGAFGPATVKDAQAWSGLTKLKEVFDRLRPRLVTFRSAEGAELFDLPDAPRPDTAPPVLFLAEFDQMLLAYADKSRIMADRYRMPIFGKNAVIRATFLVDGMVRGMWRLTGKKGLATLLVEAFEPLTAGQEKALAAEGERLIAFAAPEATTSEIVFTEASS
ncbi:winged helix DNA-binding domain-containing protein [Longispora albida]|uniref:winged helix DNA-binding domain-containing protein n=1 Tax=Longispora albida TaxID=203523 RepID=UPI0003618FD3|nr:winged helix DNA-binding domain-containing protein [Longispora albida]